MYVCHTKLAGYNCRANVLDMRLVFLTVPRPRLHRRLNTAAPNVRARARDRVPATARRGVTTPSVARASWTMRVALNACELALASTSPPPRLAGGRRRAALSVIARARDRAPTLRSLSFDIPATAIALVPS